MDSPITDIDDVFDLWKTLVELAGDIGQSQWKVIKWKKRRLIPPEYWQSICDAARARGKALTADDLMRVHAGPTVRPQAPAGANA
jgi:hypothetical protein